VVLAADSLCIGGFFPVCCVLFPVIHIWAFVYHSSMFSVVDVLCAVCYTVAEYEWMFSSLLWIFSCVSWSTSIRDGPNVRWHFGWSRRFGQAHRTSAERSAECCAL